MRKFRFGAGLRLAEDGRDWVDKCRRAQELGYDAITVPDHLGAGRLAPFPALTSAAAATDRMRVGPLVLNAPFYNPALLAREVHTTNMLTGGRLELGLGAGHMRSEFDDAGLPWWPAGQRIEYLERTIAELGDRLGAQQPPLLIAGNSDGVLSLAAKHADIVGFAGLRHAPGHQPGTFHLASADELAERVGFFAAQAGARAEVIERNMLIQHVEVTDDPRAAIERWIADIPEVNLDIDQLLRAPHLLIGTVEQIIEQVRQRRERYGFSYVTVFEHCMDEFAPVVEALAGR